ncbi:MAG: hypothetical protein PCFJNLEI_02544 [Verrucomicrobiae bacterium]|nr:hypothetical protein [Verrucomicrobiae bacterium]
MKRMRFNRWCWLAAVVLAVGVCGRDWAESPAPAPTVAEPERIAMEIGTDAYLYGLPVVQMKHWREQFLKHTPANQFRHFRDYAGTNAPSVPSPNPDVLYSVAWLDLTKEPVLLSVIEKGDRYFSFQAQNAYGDNGFYASLHGRTDRMEHHAYVGPGWSGKLPAGVQRFDNATRLVALVGRTYVAGPADLAAARAVQDSYQLTPLSQWPPPPIQSKTNSPSHTATAAVVVGVASEEIEPLQFFARLDECLHEEPPTFEYAAPIERFIQIGIGGATPFSPAGLDPATRAGLLRAVPAAKALIAAAKAKLSSVNGWIIPPATIGKTRVDLIERAAVAATRIGINSQRECRYLVGQADAAGQPLASPGRYVIRFEKDQLPPVDGFWSLTAYRAADRSLVDNPAGRYGLKSLDPALRRGADGSIEVSLQKESPGPDREANWVPTPAGEFVVMLRMYNPKLFIRGPKWQPPVIQKIGS